MSTDLVLDPEKFISSKRASEITGYAQDYIGQLSRGALIEARRIGGLWYVSMDSLLAYKNKSDDFKPRPPEHENTFPDADAFVNLDGREYISANRASKITGYNQDYVGQLARGGKIMSRQVGNRWYVDKDALVAHKEEKDALLAAVQTESVGIAQNISHDIPVDKQVPHEPLFIYSNGEGDLLPEIAKKDAQETPDDDSHIVPIRVVSRFYPTREDTVTSLNKIDRYAQRKRIEVPERSLHGAVFPAVALTVVIVLSFGLISLKKSAVYTLGNDSKTISSSVMGRFERSSLVASATTGFDSLTDFFESILTTELSYQRVR